MTNSPSVQLSRLDGDIACVTLDMPGSAANILSDGMLAELQSVLDEIHAMPEVKGLILISAKPKIFVAGANLKEINSALDWPDDRIIGFANRGRKIYQAFGQFGFPSVAAIHGACVGGGLELALGCNRRIATSDRRSIFGLPETNLGLIPGWAGTVRVPRLVGLQKGLELIVSGKTFPSTDALTMGIVDQIVDGQSKLIPAAIRMIQKEQDSGDYRDNTSCHPIPESNSEVNALTESVSATGCAQQVVKRHILSSYNRPFEAACDSEANAFAETWGSDESHGLLNHFFLGEHNKKNPGFVDLTTEPKPINIVGIIGAGLMGGGIAASCLKAGKQVKILDNNPNVAQEIVSRLGGTESGIQSMENYAKLSDCDLIIETAVENLPAKLEILREIERVCLKETIVASNTSSIPISELANAMQHPERMCGIHFCHPRLMKLVEVVRGKKTSESTLSTATSFVRGLRKTPIAMKDGPGFVVNRILSAMFQESIKQLAFGAPIQEIDQAMRAFGFAAGPFEMMDIIGTDTCLKAGQIMGQRGIACVSDSPIVPRLVKRKRLGRKSLLGFYQYQSLDSDPIIDPQVKTLLQDYVGELKSNSQELFSGDLKDACPLSTPILAAMYLEATRIQESGLVADQRDIDLCMIHGLSFPANKGGLLFWANRFGKEKLGRILQWMSDR